MDEGLKKEVERLINLNRAYTYDIKSMEDVYFKIYGSKINICHHCPAQIRAYQQQLRNWYIQSVPEVEQVIQAEPAIEKPVGCQSCKNKRGTRKK